MKSIHHMAADTAFTLATTEGFNLDQPVAFPNGQYTSIYLKNSHKVQADYFCRRFGYGLSIQPADVDLYHFLVVNMDPKDFVFMPPLQGVNNRIAYIKTGDVRMISEFKAKLDGLYVANDANTHNLWAAFLGIKLHHGLICQTLPLIEEWARQQGRI